MSMAILATKLYMPQPRSRLVLRSRLVERLNEGMHCQLTLISAPAGFGKTTLVGEWAADCRRPVAWLSMDEEDNDPKRFLTYLVAALQTVMDDMGQGVLDMLQSSQPVAVESILTFLLNEVHHVQGDFTLVLDDYHVIRTKPVDDALAFLLEHLPPPMHLLIATREDPRLPLARLRVLNQLTELRINDLRFNHTEIARYLNQVKGLNLSVKEIALLSERTEGWVAGLQLAALSMQEVHDTAGFIKSFTGNHHFVLDYLLEEVLQRQDESIKRFLLRTSVLDRMCGPLCNAVLQDPSISGQTTLEYLERSNLFIISLDNEHRWYRYHHLFGDLLRQQLRQDIPSLTGERESDVAELHRRASVWYEENNMDIDAFHHAVASRDLNHALRLMEGEGMPLHFRGAVLPVLHWLESLPQKVLDGRPSLWVMYASALSMTGQTTGVEDKLQAAEAALQSFELNDYTRNLIGHIAAIRALLAAARNDVGAIINHSNIALEYLHPSNLPVRTATLWKLGYAYQLQGDRAAARRAYTEAIAISRATKNNIIDISATIGLGNVEETDNQLKLAVKAYRHALQRAVDTPLPGLGEAHLGLARIFYQWNDLDSAEYHLQSGLKLIQQIESDDRLVSCEVLKARLKLARGDAGNAYEVLVKAEQLVHGNYSECLFAEVAEAQVHVLLHLGDLKGAAHRARKHNIPISRARVYIVQGDPSAALAVLEPYYQQLTVNDCKGEQLKVMILQAVALYACGEKHRAFELLDEALTLAEPNGFIRLFIDEGVPMEEFLSEAANQGRMPYYIGKLLAVFKTLKPKNEEATLRPLIEPLSERELEVLHLIAQGLSNQEISEQLFLAISTVKGHTRMIFGKLQVQRRTKAVARARELGLLA